MGEGRGEGDVSKGGENVDIYNTVNNKNKVKKSKSRKIFRDFC